MQTRLFALVIGIAYVLLGVIGLIPAFYTSPPADAPHLDVTNAFGLLFGQFPVNLVHDVAHIVLGLAGILAASRLTSARAYAQFLFLLCGLLTIGGFVPTLDTVWGTTPIYGSDTWVNAVTAVLAGYFGFVATEPTHVEAAVRPAHR